MSRDRRFVPDGMRNAQHRVGRDLRESSVPQRIERAAVGERQKPLSRPVRGLEVDGLIVEPEIEGAEDAPRRLQREQQDEEEDDSCLPQAVG
jgi:hypothetical protein